MISEKYSLEQTATTAFTRKQFWNEKEVNLHTIHKLANLLPPDIVKAKIKRRSKELLDQLMKERPAETF